MLTKKDNKEYNSRSYEDISAGVATALRPAVSFIISLNYLVSHTNEDIRRSTYQVTLLTISVFPLSSFSKCPINPCARFMPETSTEIEAMAGFTHMTASMATYQFTMAYIAGAFSEEPPDSLSPSI